MDEKLRFVIDLQNKASAELKKLSKDMDGVKPGAGMKNTAAWFQTLETASVTATKSMRPLLGGLNMIGAGGLAAGLSVAGLVSQFRDLARAMPAMQELSRQTGISKTELARLQYAASKLHLDPSKMTAALGTWSEGMVAFSKQTGDVYAEMQNGAGHLSQKIAKEWKDHPEAAFKDTLAWLAAIPDAAQKAGKSAQEAAQIQRYWVGKTLGDEGMAQFFGKGMEGINNALDEAAKRVAPVTDDLERAAEKFDDSITNLNTSWANIVRDLGPSFLDPMTHAIDHLDEVLKAGEKIFQHEAEPAPPRQPDGKAGESVSDWLARTARNTLRAQVNGSGMAADGQWLWETIFGSGQAHAAELPGGTSDAARGAPSVPAFHPDDDRLSRARASDADGWRQQQDLKNGVLQQFGALEKPILHLSGTLKSAAGVIEDNVHPAAFHPAGVGAGSVLDPVATIAAGTHLGFVAAFRELSGLSADGAGGGGGGFTPASFGGGGGGFSASAAGRSNMRYGAGGHSPSAAAGGGAGGSRSWRNNNPGNITMGRWAAGHGADGSDGRFAHFSTYAAGRKAQEDLWFNSDTYRGLTLAQAVGKWSPPSENDTAGIVRAYAGAIGMSPDTPLSQLTPEQRGKLLDAQQAREGWHEGLRRNGVAAPSASAGPRGAYPDWMDDKSRREMAGINAPLARDLIAASESTGTHFRILQGMRSAADAAHNAATGRGVRDSQHLYGAAADIKLTDAQGRDLDRNDPAYERYAQAYEAHSRASGGQGRWLGHSRGWSWDRAHFDQGIGYGQSHARDPYGAGGPSAADIAAGNREIFKGPDNPFLRAAKPLGDAADKLKAAVAPLPAIAPEPRRLDATAGQRAQMDPLHIHLTHQENGRTKIAARHGEGVKLSIRTAPTLERLG